MRHSWSVSVLALTVLLGISAQASGQAISVCDYMPPQNELAQLTLSGEYQQFEDRYHDDRNNTTSGHVAINGLSWIVTPSWGYNLSGRGQVRVTPTGVELASELSSDGQFRYRLRGNNFVFSGVNASGLPGSGLTVSALTGAGMGQFRNVTPMARGILIAQSLQRLDVLSEMPNPETMGQMAQIIGSERELGMAEVLQEIEGLFEASFDVETVLTVMSMLNAPMTSFCGWELTAAIGYPVIDPLDQHNPFLRVQANYALTLDADGGLLIRGEGRLPLPPGEAYQLSGSLDYHRTLSPTSTLTTTYNYTRSRTAGLPAVETHTVDLSISTELQPPLSLTANGHVGFGTEFEETEWGINLGFEYRLF